MEENKETLDNQEENKEQETTDQNEKEQTSEENKQEEVSQDTSGTEKLQLELTEQKDKYLRLYADFENFRRRTAKEKIDFLQQANADLIKNLLSVLDDFERALNSFENKDDESTKAMKEGIELIFNKLYKTLEQKGLKPMELKAGDEFDSEHQEAITQIPAPSEELKGKIVDVVEKGYYLGDKVVRFAKVVIGS